MSSELAQGRRAWSASVRDVVKSIGDAGADAPTFTTVTFHASKPTDFQLAILRAVREQVFGKYTTLRVIMQYCS